MKVLSQEDMAAYWAQRPGKKPIWTVYLVTMHRRKILKSGLFYVRAWDAPEAIRLAKENCHLVRPICRDYRYSTPDELGCQEAAA